MPIALERNLWLHAHCDDAAHEILFGHDPRAKIIWAHTGFTTPPEKSGNGGDGCFLLRSIDDAPAHSLGINPSAAAMTALFARRALRSVPGSALRRVCVAILAAVSVGAAAPAAAAALALLTDEDPPFSYTDKGKLEGSAADVVREMTTRAGVPAKFEVLPGTKAFVRAQADRDTCVFATPRLENRERLFRWIGPIATNLWAIYGKSDFAPSIRTLKDLAPYRIGAVSRDPKVEFLRDNGVADVRVFRDDALNPQRLLLARDDPDHIDLWITDLYSGRAVAKAAKVTNVKLVFIAGEEPLFLACSPQTDTRIVKALDEALDAMKTDGSFKRITADYEKRFPP